jgi:cold shock CspA family protein/ribosome-associated translation inhibitor RaiA
MQVPLELTFRGFDAEPALADLIRDKAERLDTFHDRVTSCRVAVEKPHTSPRSGNPFRVRIDVHVPPGHEVVVRREPGDHTLDEDLVTVVRDAFAAAERQLRELRRRQEGEVKREATADDRGFVVRLFRDEGYGFLRTEFAERELYFHRNAVAHDDFDALAVGTQVRFAESMGEMGPQASTVQIVDKPGERHGNGDPVAEEARPPEGWDDGRAEA